MLRGLLRVPLPATATYAGALVIVKEPTKLRRIVQEGSKELVPLAGDQVRFGYRVGIQVLVALGEVLVALGEVLVALGEGFSGAGRGSSWGVGGGRGL